MEPVPGPVVPAGDGPPGPGGGFVARVDPAEIPLAAVAENGQLVGVVRLPRWAGLRVTGWVDRPGPDEVIVDEGDAERARELLASADSGRLRLDDDADLKP